MTPPSINKQSPSEVNALHKQIAALQQQLTATEVQVTVLRQDNNRLEAALAVERGARDPDALKKARHDLHLVTYKLSRLLKVFDELHVERPDLAAPLTDFVSDDFLTAFVARIEAFFAQKLKPDTATAKNDPPPSGIVDDDPVEPPQPTGLVSNIEMATPQIDPQPMLVTPDPTRNVDADDAPPKPESPTVSPPSSPKPIAIDDSNPAANILRLLIGASSVEVHHSPPRVRIQIVNEERQREAAFFLSCENGIMKATKDIVKFDNPQLPHFLEESSIEFEVDQAPNFLILFMGAMLDFAVEPTQKHVEVDKPPTPTQPPLTEDNMAMEV